MRRTRHVASRSSGTVDNHPETDNNDAHNIYRLLRAAETRRRAWLCLRRISSLRSSPDHWRVARLRLLGPVVADRLECGQGSFAGVGEAAEVLLRGGDLLVAEAVHDDIQVCSAGQEAGGRRRASRGGRGSARCAAVRLSRPRVATPGGGGSRGTAACGAWQPRPRSIANSGNSTRRSKSASPRIWWTYPGCPIRGFGARRSPALTVGTGGIEWGLQDHRHPGRRGTRDLGASGRQAKREVASQPLDHSCQPDTRTLSVTGGTRPICAAATAPGDQLLTALSAELTCPRPVARPSVTPNRDLVPAGPADSLSARLSAPR